MEKRNQIKAFEDLFKQKDRQKRKLPDPQQKRSYGSAILFYLLVMFVFSSILFVVMGSFSGLLMTSSEEERLIDAVVYDESGITVLERTVYDSNLDPQYEEYLRTDTYKDDYYVVTHAENDDVEDTLMSGEEDEALDPGKVEDVMKGVIDTWGDSGRSITLYVGANLDSPTEYHDEARIISGERTDFSPFGMSLLNFMIYLVLLPGLILILKRDLVDDFKSFLKVKDTWLVILIIGYLYLLVGNFLSNLLSSALSSLFAIDMGQSINQLTIIEALDSDGMVFMLVSAIIMGPIVKELVFRKAIFGLIPSDRIAIIVSTLSFGAIHLFSEATIQEALINGVSYFVMGIVFGIIYLRNNRNIWAPIAVHMLSNLIAILGILFIL
ncbi:MAG: CPBP family intramembrane glutamic endopeptidase [Acholeplasmataceae bacterium]